MTSCRDVVEFMLQNSAGIAPMTFEELAEKGHVRGADSDGVQFGPDAPFSYRVLLSAREKRPWTTLTRRQQFYLDHDWFLQEGEELPTYRAPLANEGLPMRLVMGHARHGVHSLYRDDSLLVALQRGEPDVFVNPDDAAARDVEDGDLIKVYGKLGSFIAMAHVSSSMQPDTLFMYHGWDPMMFRGRENFGGCVSTGGLVNPTGLVGGYGHIQFNVSGYIPNQTYHDYTCDFELHEKTELAAAG